MGKKFTSYGNLTMKQESGLPVQGLRVWLEDLEITPFLIGIEIAGERTPPSRSMGLEATLKLQVTINQNGVEEAG